MDAAGKNRYELLFMDDDGEIPSAKELVNKKKQQPPAAASASSTNVAAATKKPASNKKSTAEKENKAAALNKNDAGNHGNNNNNNNNNNNKKSTSTAAGTEGKDGPRSRQVAGSNATGGGNTGRARYNNDNNNRSVTFRTQNNEVRGERDQREQRNNRRNFRDNNAGGGGVGGSGPDGNNDQRPPRQYNRDRENRGPPRKREFDRQSGSDKTGVKAVDKRDGAGAHNWGSVKQEIDDINKSNTGDADATLTDKEDSANDQSTDQVPANEEEEAKEMTLDEYKALKQQRAKPQYNLRKAGEGEDSTQWKKGFVLSKKKEGESEEELEYDPSMYPQRVGRLQRIVDIPFKFNDERRGGFGGRGRGRGGPRPGGNQENRGERGERSENRENRGENRENRGRFEEGGRSNFNRPPRNFGERQTRNAASRVPKVDDERQFPTLG